MTEKTIAVRSSLEARPAALFVQTANRFASNIKLEIDHKAINAKSIMGIISLGILDGNVVTIMADGEDEAEALFELERFLKNG